MAGIPFLVCLPTVLSDIYKEQKHKKDIADEEERKRIAEEEKKQRAEEEGYLQECVDFYLACDKNGYYGLSAMRMFSQKYTNQIHNNPKAAFELGKLECKRRESAKESANNERIQNERKKALDENRRIENAQISIAQLGIKKYDELIEMLAAKAKNYNGLAEQEAGKASGYRVAAKFTASPNVVEYRGTTAFGSAIASMANKAEEQNNQESIERSRRLTAYMREQQHKANKQYTKYSESESECKKYIQQIKTKMIDEESMSKEELFNNLVYNWDRSKSEYTNDTFMLSISVTQKDKSFILNSEALIDGSLEIVLFKGSEEIGTGYFNGKCSIDKKAFDFGFSHTDTVYIVVPGLSNINMGDYRIEVKPYKLWKTEM